MLPIVYTNDKYGFTFELPGSAEGFRAELDSDPIPPDAYETIEFALDT